jgi:hypothetical protein
LPFSKPCQTGTRRTIDYRSKDGDKEKAFYALQG